MTNTNNKQRADELYILIKDFVKRYKAMEKKFNEDQSDKNVRIAYYTISRGMRKQFLDYLDELISLKVVHKACDYALSLVCENEANEAMFRGFMKQRLGSKKVDTLDQQYDFMNDYRAEQRGDEFANVFLTYYDPLFELVEDKERDFFVSPSFLIDELDN